MIKNLKNYDPNQHPKNAEKSHELQLFHQKILHELDNNEHFSRIKIVHPHIAKEIEKDWGSYRLHEYMVSLFNDTRGGKRHGFEKEVSHALFQILNLHDDLHPYVEKSGKLKDIWTSLGF